MQNKLSKEKIDELVSDTQALMDYAGTPRLYKCASEIVNHVATETLKAVEGDKCCMNCSYCENDLDFPNMLLCTNREHMVQVYTVEGAEIAVKPDFYCKGFKSTTTKTDGEG